jgi:hypothetical protein
LINEKEIFLLIQEITTVKLREKANSYDGDDYEIFLEVRDIYLIEELLERGMKKNREEFDLFWDKIVDSILPKLDFIMNQ